MENNTINPDQPSENKSFQNTEINQNLNSEKMEENSSTTFGKESSSTLSYENAATKEDVEKTNLSGTSYSQQNVQTTNTQTVEQPSPQNSTVSGTPQQPNWQQGQMGQQNTDNAAQQTQADSSQSRASQPNKQSGKSGTKIKNNKIKKDKSKKNNTIVTVAFAIGLVCAVGLYAVGSTMQTEVTTQKLLDPEVRPTIQIQEPEEGALTTTQIVEKVEPSVVSIDVYEKDSVSAAGSGSGVIFSQDGYIVTNAHVVEDAYALRVILNDETGYTATLVGEDVKNDIAVIKINAEGLVPAVFGDSDQIQMGEKVIAIGNAIGVFPGSPTQGIISGVNRQIPMTNIDGSTGYRTLLQTDAAINPGNSGGALVNSYGQVIGINVAKLTDTTIENIGFAIPSNIVNTTIEGIFNQEVTVETPSMGVSFIELNDTNGPAYDLPSSGLLIYGISENSDLYESQAKEGDVVTAVNDQEVTTVRDVRAILSNLQEGDSITLTVFSPETNETFTVEAKLYSASYMSSGYSDNSQAEE